MYLPKYLIGRTVTVIVMPEESVKLKKIEKARDEVLKLSIERKEAINESEGIEDSEFDKRPYRTKSVEGPGKFPDDGRFNIDISPKKKEETDDRNM